VEIELQRGDKRLRKIVVREEVRVPGVPYSAEIAPGIGYIYLSQFNERASIEVRQAYESLNPDGHLTGLILDLRGNPGGLLGEAVNVSNLFIDKGQEVVRTKGKVKEADARYLTQFNPLNREIPLVVLINGNSASASEIVAGVMQDLDRGVILGQRSFGKGLVQQTKPVSYGAQLKLTIAKYYTPSGRCIQAIDYAERDTSGAVKAIPDSLRNSFTTRNGRLVKDGAGIDPDEVVREEELPRVLFSLLQEDLVFDFANQLQRNAPEDSINPAVYTFPENAFKAFQQFVQAKGFTYETYTDELLKQIENSAKEERFADLLPELEKLKKAFTQIKEDDIQEHQDLVKQWLGSEMARRYAYERGRVIYDLRYDPVSQRAIEILNNQDVYQAILDGQP
jgi:carboxyl-terminal processing protease